MPPASPRLRILAVGGNSVSAFLSWRLSATQACDVTLVWKNGFETVSKYGVSFRSDKFGNERFKPRYVVPSAEDAAGASRASFDYVLLCVKALPDVYDLASVIESVVSPQHTCILVNTTNTLGVESYLEQRFPTNVVISLVSGVDLTQTGVGEFEHRGSTELWVGAASKNPAIPASIQNDMAEALSMTLKSGSVDCEVAPNIRQMQYERMIGAIAFHPASVLFECPNHAELIEKTGVRPLVTGVIDEMLKCANAQGCTFQPGFRDQLIQQMATSTDTKSIMYQDFLARRPMEVETYLGSPIKIAQEAGIPVPRIETLYAMLHNLNVVNQTKPQQPVAQPPPQPHPPNPRMSSAPNPASLRGPSFSHGPSTNGHPLPPTGRNGMNGMRPTSRAPSLAGGPPPMRRGPPPQMNGYPPRMNGSSYNSRGPPPTQRRGSFEGAGLEEFSHLVLYDNAADSYDNGPAASGGDLALRERELALRQKELALREREYQMRQGGGGRGPRMSTRGRDAFDDDDDEDGEDYFDSAEHGAPYMSNQELDNLDMMSVTSRRTRKAPSASQLRQNPEYGNGPQGRQQGRNPPRRPPNKNRTSAALMADMPGLRDELLNNPLMGYSSDRYGGVDRINMGHESRTNSLTAERLQELHHGGGGAPGYPMNRRGSHSPGNVLGSMPPRPMQRPSPPNGYPSAPGPNGAAAMRQPVPRQPIRLGPPGQQHLDPHNGVSNSYPPPKNGAGVQVRSLTGSASASAGSGDSNRSAPIDSEPSAHSSSSSLGPRPPIGVR